MLTAIAAFAEAFVTPIAPLLALAIALLVPTAWLARVLIAAAGALLPLAAHVEHSGAELVLTMLGAAVALLLHAEIVLDLVLPILRWLRRCLVAAWELAWLMLAMMHGLYRRPRGRRPAPPGKDRTS